MQSYSDRIKNYLLTVEVLYLQCDKQSSCLFVCIFYGSNLSSEAQDLVTQLLKKVRCKMNYVQLSKWIHLLVTYLQQGSARDNFLLNKI